MEWGRAETALPRSIRLKGTVTIMDQKTVRKTFARLGVTFQLTDSEFALIAAGGDAAHNLIKDKVAQGKFELDGETYFPACPIPREGEFYHKDDLDFAF